jgi:hypothetical protein
MRYAAFLMTITNLGVVTMNHKQDNFKDHLNETLFYEIVLWVILIGFLYMAFKEIF